MTEAREIEDYRTVIGFAGDWHGDLSWAERAISLFASEGISTVHHVGDFGAWRDRSGDKYLFRLNRLCRRVGVELYVTPGNHEDWDLLDALFVEHGNAPAPLAEHIHLLPRGYRWTHGERSFLSLGGAPSVDFLERREGRDWWPGEAITSDVVDIVAAQGHADILITHDAPVPATDAVDRVRASSRWPAAAQLYADAGARLLTDAYRAVAPQLLFHGHYHVQDERTNPYTGQHIISLDMERTAGNLTTLDLDTLEVQWLPLLNRSQRAREARTLLTASEK